MIIDYEAEGEENGKDEEIRTIYVGDYVPHVGEHITVCARNSEIIPPLCWGIVSQISSQVPPAGPIQVTVTIKRSDDCLKWTQKTRGMSRLSPSGALSMGAS